MDTYLGVIALLVGLVFLWAAVRGSVRTHGMVKGSVRIIDAVDAGTMQATEGGPLNVVQRLIGLIEVGGQTYTAQSVDRYQSVTDRVGRTIPCRYDPKDPTRFTIDPGGFDWTRVVGGLVGLVAVGIGLTALL